MRGGAVSGRGSRFGSAFPLTPTSPLGRGSQVRPSSRERGSSLEKILLFRLRLKALKRSYWPTMGPSVELVLDVGLDGQIRRYPRGADRQGSAPLPKRAS